jgi:hypothetical protein
MKATRIHTPNLVSLGTIWALTRFATFQPCSIRTYKSGHHFQGGKGTKKTGTNLVSLGTIWALTRFAAFRPCGIRTYKSGHYFPGGKEAKKTGGASWAI